MCDRLRTSERIATGFLWLLAAWVLADCLLDVVPTLSSPIAYEDHNWRESDTYAVAYNFYHESPNFFRPRIDWTQGRSGVMGMEAPILPWLGYLAMLLFGGSPTPLRWIVFLTFWGGTMFLACRLSRLERPTLGASLIVALALSPMARFESRQFQPDPFMVGLLMISVGCFLTDLRGASRRGFGWGVFWATIAFLVKIPSITFLPAFWLLTTFRHRFWFKRTMWWILPVVLTYAWRKWAEHLTSVEYPDWSYFATGLSRDEIERSFTALNYRNDILLAVIPSHVLGWVLWPHFVSGSQASPIPTRRRLIVFAITALCTATLLLLSVGARVWVHRYYALICLLPVTLIAAFGIDKAVRSTRSSLWLSLSGLAGYLIWKAPLEAEARLVAGQPWFAVYPLLLLVALWTFSTYVTPRKRKIWVTVLGALAMVLVVQQGTAEAHRTFQFASRQWGVRTFESWSSDLRRTLGQYSTRQDQVVVSVANPFFLYATNRRGFADDIGTISARGRDYYVQRNIRFFVLFAESGPVPASMRGELLGEGNAWKVYCLSDCPRRTVSATRAR